MLTKAAPTLISDLDPLNQFIVDNYFEIQNNLTDRLFARYNRIIPAIYLAGRNNFKADPLQVNITLLYCRLLTVDEPKQSVLLIADLLTEWIDPRLNWDPVDYYGIKNIVVTAKDTVWLPDVLGFDSVATTEALPEEQQSVNIAYNGSVNICKTVVIEFLCRLELTDFPFDTQFCDLQMSSFNYPENEMKALGFLGSSIATELADTGNGEWIMKNINVTNWKYKYGPYAKLYSNPVFNFVMKRSTNYYILLLITPSFILTLLCMLGLFWKPVDADSYMENLNLGFAAILAMMFVLQTGTEGMPKINETDKLSRYLIENLCLITVACIIVMLLGKTRRRQAKRNTSDTRIRQLFRLSLAHVHWVLMIGFSVLATLNFIFLVT